MGNENGRLREIGSDDVLSDDGDQKEAPRETKSEPESVEEPQKPKKSGLGLKGRRKKKAKQVQDEDGDDFGFGGRKTRQSPVAVTPVVEGDPRAQLFPAEGSGVARKESPYDMPPGSQVTSKFLLIFNVS